VLPVLLVLVLGAALARRRRQAAPLRRLRRDLARQHASPRQVGHRLATLVRQLPRVPADAVQTLQADLDALRFARDEPIAEAVATLIERAKALARGAANRHDR
jgi:hypothetical protein